MTRSILAASLVLASLSSISRPSCAQSPNPLVGKWTIEYERGRRVENGAMTPIMGTGLLTIVQQGDSMVATLEPGPRQDGSVPPPATIGGRATTDGVVFVQKTTAQMNINGEASTRELTLTWTLQATGDALTGTLARELPMMPEPVAPSPVKGTRRPN